MPDPIESETYYVMNQLAKFIDEALNGVNPATKSAERKKKFGFTLLVFKFGDKERTTNYICNALRKDMIETMKAMIQRWEQEDVGRIQ